MSYNTQHCLNFITREIDFDIIADTIKKCDADIIGLQEIRDEGQNADYQSQAKIIAEKLGYHYYYFAEAICFGGVNPYGNAIISRYPIISAETIMIPDPEIKKYDAGKKFHPRFAGEKVPALREVFEIMQRDRAKMLYAEIKNYDAELFPTLLEKFSELINEYQVADQIIAASNDYDLNCQLHKNIPGIKTMQWIGRPPVERMQIFRELAEKNFAGLDMVQLHLRIAETPQNNWIYDLPLEDIKFAFSHLGERLEVFPFGAFTEEAINTLLDTGIRQFATDEPMRFSTILKNLTGI